MKMWRLLLVSIGIVAGGGLAYGQAQPGAAAAGGVDPGATNALTAGEVVPLITIDEAPLTDAIRTLARQAGINFQFDPKVTQGAVGADGKPIPQPNVSLRWENVTALQALTALLENHSLQLVPDPRTKIARITVRDPAALEPLVTRVIALQYSNPSNLVSALAPVIMQNPRNKVAFDPRTSQLVVVATEREMDNLQKIINDLDSATRQILIEARFVETRKNPKSIRGIDWRNTLEGQRVTMGNNFSTGEPSAGPGVAPLPTTTPNIPTDPSIGVGRGTVLSPGIVGATKGSFFNPAVGIINADGVSAVISLMNQENDFNQIATPRAVALENVATELSVVRNIPVFEQEQSPGVGGQNSLATTKPNYNVTVRDTVLNEVGIKLMVTPRVYGTTNVFLDLRPEISEEELVKAVDTLAGSDTTAPIFRRQKIQTQAMVPSGNTLVLGGLKHDRHDNVRSKVPFFGDIPGLGAAFRHKQKSLEKTDLLIFITPTILGLTDFQMNPSGNEFLRTPIPADQEVRWTTFESTQPYDWTKPIDEPRE